MEMHEEETTRALKQAHNYCQMQGLSASEREGANERKRIGERGRRGKRERERERRRGEGVREESDRMTGGEGKGEREEEKEGRQTERPGHIGLKRRLRGYSHGDCTVALGVHGLLVLISATGGRQRVPGDTRTTRGGEGEGGRGRVRVKIWGPTDGKSMDKDGAQCVCV